MAYQFEREKTAKFKFHHDNLSSDTLTLAGINATLSSADVICDGISSLMAIGGYTPGFSNATRTSSETVTRTN